MLYNNNPKTLYTFYDLTWKSSVIARLHLYKAPKNDVNECDWLSIKVVKNKQLWSVWLDSDK